MASCCPCGGGARGAPGDPAVPSGGASTALPLICLVPRATGPKETDKESTSKPQQPTSDNSDSDFKLLDEDYIKKQFKLPQRALYLDPFRRPLITFPMNQEQGKNFTMARKTKINQQILDGFLHPSSAISAPSVFPYAKPKSSAQAKDADEDEEIIYILQLPDWEFTCPAHNQPIRTPRFLWHSVKKTKEKDADEGAQQGGGPLNKPKPWLLSRHTDFDLMSQCPLARPGFESFGIAAPVVVQMNPESGWQRSEPKCLEESKLKAVVANLTKLRAFSENETYCSQCAIENKVKQNHCNYVPVIMIPIPSPDQCPFDMDSEIAKMNEPDAKWRKKNAGNTEQEETKERYTMKRKRGFVMNRLNYYDLMSQW